MQEERLGLEASGVSPTHARCEHWSRRAVRQSGHLWGSWTFTATPLRCLFLTSLSGLPSGDAGIVISLLPGAAPHRGVTIRKGLRTLHHQTPSFPRRQQWSQKASSGQVKLYSQADFGSCV